MAGCISSWKKKKDGSSRTRLQARESKPDVDLPHGRAILAKHFDDGRIEYSIRRFHWSVVTETYDSRGGGYRYAMWSPKTGKYGLFTDDMDGVARVGEAKKFDEMLEWLSH